ncbi:aspartate aminotransferase family protein [Desulfohalobiaceae bacterium Ax17]|jgi:acetylornithine aminotransferase|uniref:aspartate aminotransferase family protein n=1 Tax=Desulfovulcanus ferrireducens TaxID=2831190 RepID=UPI00207BB436|nr:aspartate aminotransferase family protein [Desulfovulcanus ferrireducens]MBT8763424.1 aspartate aminotransferase family protein [Desulfovulcanus ferrireducens]
MNKFNIIKTKEKKLHCPTYGRYPLAVKKAKGYKLYDFDGQEYIDLLAGISVCNLGHSHPEIVQVIKEQAEKLIHVSNLFYQEEQLGLAERLLGTTHLNRAFFCNSGAEANEGAIKLARRYMQKIKNKDKFEIITLAGSFHGRTLATLTATGQDKLKEGFSPYPTGFKIVPFNDITALKNGISEHTAAIMLEVIQGEGGVRPLHSEYLVQVQNICRENDLLFIIDEVQTGLARTGKFWAHQHYNLKPDIVTSAKALGNGLPIGALLTTQEISEAFGPGSHGTTFGGNALICKVAEKVVEIILRDNLAEQTKDKGQFCLNIFSEIKDEFPDLIAEVRGAGLMLGIELTIPGHEIWNKLLKKGFVLNLTQEKVLRLLPPLIIPEEELVGFAQALKGILAETV